MEQYLINDLERLTGIKAHTIRIWEKRYMVIQPSRTATNRRYYNGEQLKKLMNISTLLSEGQKISAVAGLSNAELTKQVEDMQSSPEKDTAVASFIHDLTLAMLKFNEQGFERVFAAANKRFGFYDCMVRVFYPFLNKIGLLWSVDKAMPVQEHFAAAIIRRKIITATDNLPSASTGKKFLLFLPPGEWHEIGLLFANYIIRSKGHDTIYLGQNVPFADIKKVIKATNPQCLLIFYITHKSREDIEKEMVDLTKDYKNVEVYIAGNDRMLAGINATKKNVIYLNSIDSLLQLV